MSLRKRMLGTGLVFTAWVTSGCATTPKPIPDHSGKMRTLERANHISDAKLATQAETIRELQSQLALAHAEIRELRANQTRGVTETVRIGRLSQQDTEKDGNSEACRIESDFAEPKRPEARSRGRRPVLRLYGMPVTDVSIAASAPSEDMDFVAPAPPYGVPERLPIAPLPGAKGEPSAPSADAQAANEYRAALASVRDRHFREAISAFTEFLAKHNEPRRVASAMYWRGEAYYALREFRRALADFEAVTKQFPEEAKAADALYKSALCFFRLGDSQRAKQVVAQLKEKFPNSVAARLMTEDPS